MEEKKEKTPLHWYSDKGSKATVVNKKNKKFRITKNMPTCSSIQINFFIFEA